ncbi:hypothetical protein [Bdellovibrio svalbardensis]|uniref:Carbohydrate-binding family V/XII n=1 Tax=Bdellovibrio svalbardensis TaxID=2972972 RepID=A0ABT6DFR8_9BACT|nr:hypothetical protein [Bdellovibrio svalbardensis]MDG0815312.1 hypothetical protein [Bdellovibrio svalbardensis]
MRWLLTALLFSSYISVAIAAKKASTDLVWPKEFSFENKQAITMFQPQVDSLQEGMVTATSAFRFSRDKKEYFGSFRIQGKALINKETNVVTLSNIKISNVQLPAGKFDVQELQRQIEEIFAGKQYQVSYQSLIKNRDVQVSEGDRPAPDIKNVVPNFIYITRPGILVMVSGDPVWGESKGAKEVKRVINTSALIMHEDKKEYYIWGIGRWFSAPELMGPYKVAKAPGSKFVIIKDDLVKNKKIDPMDGKTSDGKSIYAPSVIPDIYISTKPAELLQSEGEPKFQAVQKTGLLYMANSPNSIFLDSNTQDYFVLVTGRWFTAKNLKSGPWSYVSGRDLPKDFAKIPTTSPVAEVLVSVPGSPQSKEAQIVSKIPQMAEVKKDLKPKNIECDGAQKWAAIAGTNLKFAENCNTPIIQVTEKQFYAVQDGVWFTSSSGAGPWSVAVVVPDDIYKMPSSSPIYYVTYVHIYGVSDDSVTVGYTPGYHGTFVSADGTIVYGTGYVYPSYISESAWYPAPATYGFGVGYGWGYSDGFYMGYSMGSIMYPWGWGSCCWGGIYVNISVTNVYHNWGTHTVVTGSGGRGFNVNTVGNTKFVRGHGSNEIYAGHDGQVYRRNPDGQWQQYQGPGAWEDVNRGNTGQLENLHQTRSAEPVRQPSSMAERPAASQPDRLRGGGARASGGFRGGGGRR